MTDILAVDPGKKDMGIAYFQGKHLCAATLIRGSDELNTVQRALLWSAEAVSDWREDAILVGGKLAVTTLVTESQQIYRVSKADPNDLLPLAFVCGAMHASIEAKNRYMPIPRLWKGSIPKEVMTRRILSKLDKQALDIVNRVECPQSLIHNVIDAIGLGLYALGIVSRDEPEYTS